MGNWKKHFSTKHLDSGDLDGIGKAMIKITGIGDCDETDTDGERKMLITFEPGSAFAKVTRKRTWIASKTIGYQLEAMFGSNDQDWIGKLIVVYSAPIRGGEAVRIYGSPAITKECSCTVREFGGGRKTWTMRPTPLPSNKPAPAPTPAELAASDAAVSQ